VAENRLLGLLKDEIKIDGRLKTVTELLREMGFPDNHHTRQKYVLLPIRPFIASGDVICEMVRRPRPTNPHIYTTVPAYRVADEKKSAKVRKRVAKG
jgi:hypothetical protein